MITFDDWKKVELVTARVVTASAHPDADRLLVLSLDIGTEEPRQVVAGIREHYEPESLVGKTVVALVNLDPVKIRGVESGGMVLAVKDGDAIRLLTVDAEVAPGRRVT
jgi:methionine--tRNA ligase beta chain